MRWTLLAVSTVIGLLAAACAPVSTRETSLIPYFIEEGKNVEGFDPGDRELAEWALAAWARESGGRLKFVPAPRADRATIRIRWISPGSGLYGEMERVDVGGRAGAIVNVSAVAAGPGGPLATRSEDDRLLRDSIVYLTCVHELGHALGLEHTRNFEDIMYAFGYGGDIAEYFSRYRRKLRSRADIASESGLSANDVAVLKALYGATADR